MIKYGKAENQSRDGLANPILPYSCVKLSTAPIIPQIIPALDQFMYGWIKFQQGMKMATIDGYSIDIGTISNLSLGGKKMNPLEVIKMWRQTGILFRKDTNAIGKITTSGVAIQQMKGGAGTIFEESLRSMNQAMSLIEQTTGINPISLGASPSADQGKAVTEYSIAGTNDILKGIVQRASVLKSFVAKNMCLRLQFVVKNKSRARKGYGGVIGDDRLELLKIAEGNDVKYGMKTHTRPQNQEKQDLLEMISLSLKNGRDGKVGITEGDAVRFKSMIENGTSLKRVALVLDYANRKAKEEAAATAQQNIKVQGEQQQQLEALQAQNRQVEVQLEIQKQVTIDNNKAKLDAGLEAVKNGKMTYEDYEVRVLGIQKQPQSQPMQQQQQQPSVTQEAPIAGMENPETPIRGTGAEMEV